MLWRRRRRGSSSNDESISRLATKETETIPNPDWNYVNGRFDFHNTNFLHYDLNDHKVSAAHPVCAASIPSIVMVNALVPASNRIFPAHAIYFTFFHDGSLAGLQRFRRLRMSLVLTALFSLSRNQLRAVLPSWPYHKRLQEQEAKRTTMVVVPRRQEQLPPPNVVGVSHRTWPECKFLSWRQQKKIPSKNKKLPANKKAGQTCYKRCRSR